MSVFFQDGKFFLSNNLETRVLGAREIWELKSESKEPSLATLKVLGFGFLTVLVEMADNNPKRLRVSGQVDSDGYSLTLNFSNEVSIDYLTDSKHLIPMKQELLISIEREFRPILNRLGEQEPEVAAVSLTKACNRVGVAIKFSNEVSNYLETPPPLEIDSPIDTPLWEYQKDGLAWMLRLWKAGLGGILGDEMGVGKTLQIIALSCEVAKQSNYPALIVVPSGLLLKWCKDFVDHAPSFMKQVHVHYGPSRFKSQEFLTSKSIILTTYSLVVQDEAIFRNLEFSAISCDEAHELKESRTLKSQAIKNLSSGSKFLATGTPIQNNLSDYWTLMDLVEPGILGLRESFELQVENTPKQAAQLVQQTKHKILRRTQEQVGIDIPEGTEFLVPLELSEEYLNEYLSNPKLSPQNSGRASISHRRQFCAHPATFNPRWEFNAGEKASYLITELEKILLLGEKVVIFVADFNEPRDLYLELVQKEFPEFWTGTIDGRTPIEHRHILLEQFSQFDGPGAIFINPQVGGQGLNIIAANHVFHMNPAWNPAKTDQATFRVTRPGQTRETWSHHLFYVGTIEESIHQLVASKRAFTEAGLAIAEADSESRLKSILGISI